VVQSDNATKPYIDLVAAEVQVFVREAAGELAQELVQELPRGAQRRVDHALVPAEVSLVACARARRRGRTSPSYSQDYFPPRFSIGTVQSGPETLLAARIVRRALSRFGQVM
jgi:hypothetical protein